MSLAAPSRLLFPLLAGLACGCSSVRIESGPPRQSAEDAKPLAIDKQDYSNSYFLLHSGAVALSPLKIERKESGGMTEFRLVEGGTEVSAYVEGYVRHRPAWLEPEEIVMPVNVEARIGTSFLGEDTISTIVGSGEIYGEVALGWDVFRSWTNREEPRTVGERGRPTFALGPELVVGTVSDRAAQDNHPYYMIGGVLSGAVPFLSLEPEQPKSDNGTQRLLPMRKVEWAIGLFYGLADFPDFVDNTTNLIQNNRGFPRFRWEPREPAVHAVVPSPSARKRGESVARESLLVALSPVLIAPGLASQAEAASRATNEFGLALYAQLRANEGNLFYSPYSIAVALAMTREGARNRTAAQMDRVLRRSGDASSQHAALAKQLTPREVREGWGDRARKVKTYELHVANALWGQQGLGFAEPFTTTLAEAYGAPLRHIDFRDREKARRILNEWVEQQTRGRIEDLVPDGMPVPATKLALANAIYFKAAWQEPFLAGATKKRPFTTTAGDEVRTPMMHRTEMLLYAALDGVQIVELPYKSADTSMVIVLPKKMQGLAEIEKKLDAERLRTWIRALNARRVALVLPKFRFTSSFGLKEPLRAMGMPDAFDKDRADFSGMTSEDTLMIDAVLHKAFVAVDEEGTEAAAATMVMMTPTGMAEPREPVPFVADHPFLFLIRHRGSGCVLFLGRLARP